MVDALPPKGRYNFTRTNAHVFAFFHFLMPPSSPPPHAQPIPFPRCSSRYLGLTTAAGCSCCCCCCCRRRRRHRSGSRIPTTTRPPTTARCVPTPFPMQLSSPVPHCCRQPNPSTAFRFADCLPSSYFLFWFLRCRLQGYAPQPGMAPMQPGMVQPGMVQPGLPPQPGMMMAPGMAPAAGGWAPNYAAQTKYVAISLHLFGAHQQP